MHEGIRCINPASFSNEDEELALTFTWKEFFYLTSILPKTTLFSSHCMWQEFV